MYPTDLRTPPRLSPYSPAAGRAGNAAQLISSSRLALSHFAQCHTSFAGASQNNDWSNWGYNGPTTSPQFRTMLKGYHSPELYIGSAEAIAATASQPNSLPNLLSFTLQQVLNLRWLVNNYLHENLHLKVCFPRIPTQNRSKNIVK